MSQSDPRLYWFALKTVPLIGNVRYNALVRKFGSPQKALEAAPTQLAAVPDFGESTIKSIKEEVDFEAAEKQMELLEKSGARLITNLDAEYPTALKKIYDPPPFILVKGELTTADDNAVGIVGSRVCTTYGTQVTEQLARALVEAGFTVVSGMARGIDSIAHSSAMKSGGRTVAVLGCGLDVIYPPENEKLYNEIYQSGAVISEFFFGLKPDKYNFPSRNRIISGMSRGVVVVEAGRSSGALLTAQHALEQNREVFAVPGNISSAASAGTNDLIKQGAIPVTSAADVLLALGHDPSQKSKQPKVDVTGLPVGEQQVYNRLSDQPLQIDRLAAELNRPVAETLALLFNLEMAGLVRQLPGKLFLREM